MDSTRCAKSLILYKQSMSISGRNASNHHLHCFNDYLVEGSNEGQPWACRVVANPLGYVSKGEQASFREHLVIEL